MRKNTLTDIVFRLLDEEVTDDSTLLTKVAQQLEDLYTGEQLEVNLERMGIETTKKLKYAINTCKLQYTIEHRQLAVGSVS